MGLNCTKSWTSDSKQDGDGTQISLSHEAYLFMASKHGEVDEWRKVIERGMWAPFKSVFGQKLEDTVSYEKRYGDKMAPMIVEQCVDFIRKRGLQEVGLFRLPGQANLVKDLQDAFDAGEKPTFDSNTDVHTVASLLKLYLRKLPEPVIPFSKYEDFLICAKLLTEDKEEGIKELKKLLKDLSTVNLNLLQYICRFLDEVQSYSNVNKMSIRNLATVFGPNILRPKVEDPETIIGGTALVQQLMSVMISEHDKLFPRAILSTGLTGQSPAGKVLMTSVNSLAKEELCLKNEPHVHSLYTKSLTLPLRARSGLTKNLQQGCISSHPRMGTNQPIYRCQSNTMEKSTANTEGNDKAISTGDLRSHAYNNHCFKLKHEGESAIHTLLKETDTDTGSAGAQNGTLPNTQTASGNRSEKQKTRSTKENRIGYACASKLSVYDNVDCVPLLNSENMNTDCMSRSNLSCEIIHGDNSGSHYSSRTTCPDDILDLNLCTPTISGFSDNFVFGASNNSASGMVISTNDSSLDQSTLQCLIDLRQQMIKQKAEYESRIKSLEQRNQELELEVQDLQSNLEQQRKWFNVVEIKMRNAERAREDAEKRNEMLQKEMEEFFGTFGELTNEVKKTEKIAQSF